MKKLCVFIIALVLMVGVVCSAMAYDEEIVWQDIPWDSTKADALKIMIGNKWIQSEKDTVFSAYGSDEWAWASFITKVGGFCEWTDNKIVNLLRDKGIRILATKRGVKPELAIAGYAVKAIVFTFAPDGKLMTTGVSLGDASPDDLIQKLESVYGESELPADREDTYSLYFVKGANDTAVALVECNFWGDGPYLVYGKTTWEEILNIQLAKTTPEPLPQADSSDTSGL